MAKKKKVKHDWLAVVLEKQSRDELLNALALELAKETGKKELLFSPHPIGSVEVVVFQEPKNTSTGYACMRLPPVHSSCNSRSGNDSNRQRRADLWLN